MSNKYLPYLGLVAATFAVGKDGDSSRAGPAGVNLSYKASAELGLYSFTDGHLSRDGTNLNYGYAVDGTASFGEFKLETHLSERNTINTSNEAFGDTMNSVTTFTWTPASMQDANTNQSVKFFATTNVPKNILSEEQAAFGVEGSMSGFKVLAAVCPESYDYDPNTANAGDEITAATNGGLVNVSWGQSSDKQIGLTYYDNPNVTTDVETYISADASYKHADAGKINVVVAQRRAGDNPTKFGLGYTYESGKVSAKLGYAQYEKNFHVAATGQEVNMVLGSNRKTYGLSRDWANKFSEMSASVNYKYDTNVNLAVTFDTNNTDGKAGADTTATGFGVKVILG